MPTAPSTKSATVADWLAQPEDARLELIDGELIPKAAPTAEHGRAQVATGISLGAFARRGSRGGPGGWWIASEVDILLDGRGYRPDLAGWRRDRVPALPRQRPMTVRPDWVCEIVSESNRSTDTVKKVRRYHQAGVPHYWILDEVARALTVYRHGPDGYIIALAAEADEVVRAEPFDAIEVRVGALFGDDDPDE
ncbi:MAG: Uma2 family endonuclease [Myxococcales bacterium]|nr:Uma2 family endonuclease [Myxococcales bacterium]